MEMNRRRFLKQAGTGLILLSAAPMVGCQGVQRADLPQFGIQEHDIKGLDKEDMDILYMASLAPSGYNAQAWTVKVVGRKHWVIGSDKKRWLKATDPDNLTLLLSTGAFIENLVIAAGTFGYETDVQITTKDSMDTEIAHIRLTKGKLQNYPLERLKYRRKYKEPYKKKEIKPVDIKYLKAHSPESIIYFPKGSLQSKYIEEGMYECNRIQFYRKDARKQLAMWLRFSDKDARRHRDGITTESMSIQGFSGWYVRNFYDPQDALEDGFYKRPLDELKVLLESQGGWIVFTGKDSGVHSLIETGRRFERLWLKARERSIAIHPCSQMIEEAPGSTIGIRGVTGEVHFIMRVGYIDNYPGTVSLRRPVSWFVKT
jgi:hypothetical protein